MLEFVPLFCVFTFRRWTVRVSPSPEEGVGAEPVVGEALDEQECLVDGVDGAADIVLMVGELPHKREGRRRGHARRGHVQQLLLREQYVTEVDLKGAAPHGDPPDLDGGTAVLTF